MEPARFRICKLHEDTRTAAIRSSRASSQLRSYSHSQLSPHSTVTRLERYGWLYASFILVNCSIGGGIIGMPYSVARAGGIIPGAFVITTVTVIAHVHYLALGKMAQEISNGEKEISLTGVTEFYFGQGFAMVMTIALAFAATFNVSVYFQIISTLFEDFFAFFIASIDMTYVYKYPHLQQWLTLVIFFCFCLPTSLMPHYGKLKKISVVLSLSAAYLFGLCIYVFVTTSKHVSTVNNYYNETYPKADQTCNLDNGMSAVNLLKSFPVLVFANVTVGPVPMVVSRMQPNGVGTLTKAITFCGIVVLTTYLGVSLLLVSAFGCHITPNLFHALSASSPPVLVGVVLYTLKISFEVPLFLILGRRAFLDIIEATVDYLKTKKSIQNKLANIAAWKASPKFQRMTVSFQNQKEFWVQKLWQTGPGAESYMQSSVKSDEKQPKKWLRTVEILLTLVMLPVMMVIGLRIQSLFTIISLSGILWLIAGWLLPPALIFKRALDKFRAAKNNVQPADFGTFEIDYITKHHVDKSDWARRFKQIWLGFWALATFIYLLAMVFICGGTMTNTLMDIFSPQ